MSVSVTAQWSAGASPTPTPVSVISGVMQP
jgi:hypothetical protein